MSDNNETRSSGTEQPRRHRSLGAWLKRYISFSLVCIVGILVYMLFFTDNSIANSYEHDREIMRLRELISQNQDSLEYYRQLNERLSTDPGTMEQIVRERYHMQRPGEDVYIVK